MKVYEITFGGSFKAQFEVDGNEIHILAAMDGWGNPIHLKDVEIVEI